MTRQASAHPWLTSGRRLVLAVAAGALVWLGADTPQTARADGLDRLGAYLQQSCDFAANAWCKLPGDPADSYITRDEGLQISRGDPEALDRLWGWGGPKETFGAWGSAAFDGRRLYFFGGGHHHYRGNDIKVYDLETLSWSRLYDPSYVTSKTHPAGNKRFVPERGPRAVHVYDGLTYAPRTNALYLWGSESFDAWEFDLDTWQASHDPWQAWSRFPMPESGHRRELNFFRTAAQDDGQILVHGGLNGRGRGAIFVFDPETKRYSGGRRELFQITALTSAGPFAYGTHPKDDVLVVYDRQGKSVGRIKMPSGFTGESAAYDPARDVLVFWDGGDETLALDLARAQWHQVAQRSTGTVPKGSKNGPWGSWQFVPAHNVFVGLADDADGHPAMWAYRLPDPLPTEHPLRAEREAQGYTCSDEVVGWTCPDLKAQIATGKVQKGVYQQCAKVDRPVDFNGSWLKDKVCQNKAALIAKDGAVIENVKITDISINLNANCVRWEDGDVVLRNVTCRRADMGVLGGGRHLTIEDSEIAGTLPGGRNLGHLIYACPNRSVGTALVIRRSKLLAPGDEGHALKTGCETTRLEDSVIDGGDGRYSRLIDAFNGGHLVIEDSVLTVGTSGGNGDVIGYGAGMRQRHPVNRIELRGGRVDCAALPEWGHALHTWPEKLTPETVTWQPGKAVACPKP